MVSDATKDELIKSDLKHSYVGIRGGFKVGERMRHETS